MQLLFVNCAVGKIIIKNFIAHNSRITGLSEMQESVCRLIWKQDYKNPKYDYKKILWLCNEQNITSG